MSALPATDTIATPSRWPAILRAAGLTAAGAAAGFAAVFVANAELKFLLVAVVGGCGLAFFAVLGESRRIVLFLLLGLSIGLTIKLDVSFLQHFEATGHYIPNVGGAAGITVSTASLVSLALLAVFAFQKQAGLRDRVLHIHWPLVAAQLAFMLVGLFSLINARDPLYLWFEELRYLNFLLIFLAISGLEPNDVRNFVVMLALATLMQTTAASLQFVSGSSLGLEILGDVGPTVEIIDFGKHFRASGFKVHPNILGYYYETLLPVCLAVALSHAPVLLRWGAAIGVASALAGLLMTLSRAAWMTLPVSFVAIGLLVYRDRLFTWPAFRALAAIGAVSAAAMIFAGPIIYERLFADDGGSASLREPLNRAAIMVFEKFPFIGAGLNNFPNMFPEIETHRLFSAGALVRADQPRGAQPAPSHPQRCRHAGLSRLPGDVPWRGVCRHPPGVAAAAGRPDRGSRGRLRFRSDRAFDARPVRPRLPAQSRYRRTAVHVHRTGRGVLICRSQTASP